MLLGKRDIETKGKHEGKGKEYRQKWMESEKKTNPLVSLPPFLAHLNIRVTATVGILG
jgi:hypothetical protein